MKYKPRNINFWDYMDRTESSCWEWKGYRNKDNYGQFQLKGKIRYTHCVAYELAKGAIPEGMEVCHTCDNPPCCNPDHLWLGTHHDNMLDMKRKGRNKFVCAIGEAHRGSKFTSDQVVSIRREYATGKVSLKALASKYNVGKSTIYDIVTGHTWKHIDNELVSFHDEQFKAEHEGAVILHEEAETIAMRMARAA